ncbi:HAD-IIA family hydrolase [Pseudomonas citronellolis]|uniref:HAD-IIA family hydrolase n=1 Tax=Pseudomonas citronellolis TaxID=53408 RepID=UPI0021BFFBB6|nr:HAD-IIA family hydrolase [Pseudomonas citronellolis]MDN6871697.1 HAD-IIA family hydrolase [Pseudomonas citronellolis]UXJ54179.1 HAD-IIA family hydrolase [Pseudomonas citronellolis]WBG65984.1 HAD-IIA family hydrolase [Pseudomonas citronellolis]
MIGVILAAGVGSRLRPMTNSKPKCLVSTAGKPILQYQIDAYIEAGVRHLIIVVGYEGNAIKEYCKHIKDVEIKIIENVDYETTNNMYSLYLAKDQIGDAPFILNNADLSIDLTIVKKLLQHPEQNSIAVDSSLYNDESMKVSTNERGLINDISKKISKEDAFACSIDFYKFSQASSKIFFDEITRIIEIEKNLKDWTEVAMQRLFQAGKMQFSPCDIAGLDWVEIDNYEDLALSDRKFSKFDSKMQQIDNIFFDMDGTVYLGNTIIPGARETIEKVSKDGKRVFFLSNNSSRSKEDYVQKLKKLDIEANTDQIILSTDAVLSFLRTERVEKVHILGTNSLKKTFIDHGFQIDSASPEYVVIGYDTELSYQKLITACKYINSGADIIATHCDTFCPSEDGPIPDIGALVEMIRLTTGKSPSRTFGKPNKEMLLSFMQENSITTTNTLIVGDRLHTDIEMAANVGCHALLVLSGETSRDQVETSKVKPNFILNSIKDM